MTESSRFPDFKPVAFLGNAHVQTVLANLWSPDVALPATRKWHLPLADGDELAVHDTLPAAWREGDRAAVLVHGLGGCHASGYMVRIARRLFERGWRVLRLDLRGAGAGAALARRTYNAACSDDVRAAALALHQQAPASPLTLIGLSLGGNIVLKLAGEAAQRPVPGLQRVAALAPPIDLERCAELIAAGRNRLYERYYVRNLVRQVRRVWRLRPDVPRAGLAGILTLRQFDEVYTAPRGGFANALDYYRRASAGPLIGDIEVPALIVTARDDPFIAVEPFTTLPPASHREVHLLRHGGHLGFLGHDGSGGLRWAEHRLVEWVCA